MGRTIERRSQSYDVRRAAIRRVAELLAAHANHKTFVPSYTRMNPAATHSFNTFYFGKPNYVARAIIFGPWLYIHAPNFKLPREVILISEKERRRKHLGKLTAKVLLTSGDPLRVIERVIESFKKGPKNPDTISHLERVHFPEEERGKPSE